MSAQGGVCRLPMNRMTDACENIAFPQLQLRAAMMQFFKTNYVNFHRQVSVCTCKCVGGGQNKLSHFLESSNNDIKIKALHVCSSAKIEKHTKLTTVRYSGQLDNEW